MTKNRRSDRRQTARNPAPVELTGDAGGGFEAEVAAYFLAEMLRCGTGMGEDLGQIRGVRFQIKDTGSELDDLGLELIWTNDDRRWASVSVKRHRQVTRFGFPPSFVYAVWRQRLAGLSDDLRRGHEVMMLAVGELAGDVESAWQDMLHEATEARGDESRLVQRWTSVGLASKIKRQLFASLQCPAALSAQAASDPLLLERIWPILIANNGHLLRRLLQRFLHVATVPDRRMLALAKDEQEALWFAAQCRVAGESYWSNMVPFLHRHRSDLARFAPVDSARVAQMWLTSRPVQLSKGRSWVFRRECAEIAILIAREFQARLAEGVYFHDGEDEAVFSAALHAAPDVPSEVSQFALELCCRRDESAETAARRKSRKDKKDAKRQQATQHNHADVESPIWFPPLGPLRKPWPDGPFQRVKESVRKVCLNSVALQPRMACQPEVAKEVILAVCIEEPKHANTDHYDASLHEEDLGVKSFLQWGQPIYFRGPFLPFLRISPNQGIDLIVRLANFSADRWKEWVLKNCGIDVDLAVDDDLCVSVMSPSGPTRWLLPGSWRFPAPIDCSFPG